MSQNGDEEVRDAMINPIQRRESSASRFLKHFRPDRNNPAYHSEGKGLRSKRRHWNSERQLTPPETTNVAAAPAAEGAEGEALNTCTASANAPTPNGQRQPPQRSHSFSEPDATGSLVRCNPSAKEQQQQQHNGGVRDSFRWRFRSSRSSSSSDCAPKGGDTSQKTIPIVVSSSGSVGNSNWPPNGGDVVVGAGIEPIYINNNSGSGGIKNGPPSSPSAVMAGSTYSARVYAAAAADAVDAAASAESDYVNYEVFAAQLNKQNHLEPDLLRNLPYQQQQQNQRPSYAGQPFSSSSSSSPRRHSNSRR